jgi:RNA ligase (TIGR02306 family)
VLPDAPWATIYKAKSNRVKAIKLRQVWSMGIVEPISLIPVEGTGHEHQEGDEVSEILGITKYEPPLPQDINAKGNLPHGINKTDEEKFQNILDLPFGEIVDVTLKIDGQSTTGYCKEISMPLETSDWEKHYDFGITTRAMDLKLDSVCNQTVSVKSFFDKFVLYCKDRNLNLALRGETYGKGIQAFKGNPHAQKNLGFALFNVLNLDTLNYEGTDSPLYFEKLGKELGIETVPILEKGVVLTPELIKKYDEDLTEINGQPFEGVVIKLKNGGSFKVINKHYDSKK